MKRFYLLTACLAFSLLLTAQPTCSDPLVLIQDDFESYALGVLGPQADHWTTWSGDEGGMEDGIVTSDNAASGNQSLSIEGTSPDGGPQDVILDLGNQPDGMFLLTWNMYVAGESGAYFNLQRSQTPGEQWAVEVYFENDATGYVSVGTEEIPFAYTQDEWFEVRMILDVSNDFMYLFFDTEFIYAWPVSWQVGSQTGGYAQIGAVDFFPLDQTHFFYVDDVYFAQLPEAEAGQYCHMAIPVDTGIHTAIELQCYGAGFTVRSGGQGRAGAWYEWTAPADGILSVSSCGGGRDTRVWIFSGGCSTLQLEGVNDDRCEMTPGGDEYASYREVLVSAGTTYHICWDDIWDGGGFQFELAFSEMEPTPGDFCASAIPVMAGDTLTIDQINGDAAVAGPDINHTGASTTNYAQSEWYVFTPEVNGLMTISSCNFTDEDTRLWVYTGTCGFDNLELVASSDDDCGLQSIVFEMEVTAGTTYYIEWDSEDTDAPGFQWEIVLEPETGTSQPDPAFAKNFLLAPNPASDRATLQYRLDRPTALQVQLTDVAGRPLHRWSLPRATDGRIELPVRDLPTGLYLITIRDEGGRHAVHRLVKTR